MGLIKHPIRFIFVRHSAVLRLDRNTACDSAPVHYSLAFGRRQVMITNTPPSDRSQLALCRVAFFGTLTTNVSRTVQI